MKTMLLFLTLIALQPESAHSGAWPQKKGALFYKLGVLRFESTSQYLLNGKRQRLSNLGRVVDVSLYSYLEYGLMDNITVIASLPVKRITFDCAVEDCRKSSSGLADLQFGLRYRLAAQPWVISLESSLKLAPGYEINKPEQLQAAPPLGDGQTDYDLRLLAGKSILKHAAYLNLEAGYRARSGAPVDEIPFSLELGLNLTKEYLLIGKFHGVRSISEDQAQQNFRIVDGRIENFVGTGAVEDFVKLQLQFVYRMSRRINLAFDFDQVLTGRNTSRATTFGGGVIYTK